MATLSSPHAVSPWTVALARPESDRRRTELTPNQTEYNPQDEEEEIEVARYQEEANRNNSLATGYQLVLPSLGPAGTQWGSVSWNSACNSIGMLPLLIY